MTRPVHLVAGRCLLTALLALSASVACAHQRQDDPPLYEDLLFAELDPNKPKPEYEFPFDVLIEDDVPEAPGDEEDKDEPVHLQRPREVHWEEFVEEGHSESVGKPNHGYLKGGVLLPHDGRGFLRKNDKAPYGTGETVALVMWACARMVALYPGTVPVVVGDLSTQKGGRLRPHASHQSGRDVDVGYYFRGNRTRRRFVDATPQSLDVEKTWTFIELLLSTHRVEFLFIDRTLQPLLYGEARLRGWTEEELQDLFEAPLGARARHGIIRHSKGHKHHLHVRFKCDKSDDRCK